MNAHAQVRPNHHRSNGILGFAKRKGGVVETRCCLEHLRQERLGHYDRSRTRSTRRYREANDPTGHRRCTRTARPIIDGVPRGYFAMVGWCCGRPRCRIIRVRSPKNRADSYVQCSTSRTATRRREANLLLDMWCARNALYALTDPPATPATHPSLLCALKLRARVSVQRPCLGGERVAGSKRRCCCHICGRCILPVLWTD